MSDPIQIRLNGESHELEAGTTALQLLQSLQLTERRLAMEVNREILPRSRFESYCFNAGDEVEIVHAIGGG